MDRIFSGEVDRQEAILTGVERNLNIEVQGGVITLILKTY